jgi:hypothetical protein
VKAEHLLLAGLVLVFVALAVSTISIIAFCLRLKRYEHGVWIWLGSPQIPRLSKERLRRTTAVLLFLKNRLHHSLRDEKCSKLGDLVVVNNRILLGITALVCAITGYVVLFVNP